MTTKTEELIEQIKEVQLRGNTHPKNMGLLDKIIDHLRHQEDELDDVYRNISMGMYE